MVAALDDIASIVAKESAIGGILPSDDGPPPAVLFMVRTCDDRISAVVILSASHAEELAAGLLMASKEVFGTNEHAGSQGKLIH